MYLEKFDLSGRTAFITGGGRGIGLASAAALLEAGARVILSDISAAVLEEGRDALSRGGPGIDTVVLDITDPGAVGRAAAAANDRHGGRV